MRSPLASLMLKIYGAQVGGWETILAVSMANLAKFPQATAIVAVVFVIAARVVNTHARETACYGITPARGDIDTNIHLFQ
jgi:hypothetical protein